MSANIAIMVACNEGRALLAQLAVLLPDDDPDLEVQVRQIKRAKIPHYKGNIIVKILG